MAARTLTTRLQVRLFFTCWLVFVVHFATDVVREHYLAFSIAEDYSFRVDKYLDLNPDLFETPGRGAHIGANPGMSMLAAIPYWIFRPAIARVVTAVNAARAGAATHAVGVYNDPRPRRVEFYRTVFERGLDVQFGLAAAVMQALLMAPASALAAVVMLRLLVQLGVPIRTSLLGAFLYAFGTPIFLRTGYLNHNVFIAHLLLFGFVALWRPGGSPRWRDSTACLFAGLMGGYSFLSDYSGALVMAVLGCYAVWLAWQRGSWRQALRDAAFYAGGAAGPVALLLFYQWSAFGSPWYPGQNYMPPVEWIEIGYKGVALPQWRLFKMLLLDPRFGLFVACPMLALGIVGLVLVFRRPTWLPRREAAFLGVFSLAFVVFFSAVQYTQLQWISNVRYIVPVIPALFLPTFVALLWLPPLARYFIIVIAFAESWSLSMIRSTNSIADDIIRVLFGGFQLPVTTVLSKMAPQYLPFMAQQASPLAILALCAAIIYGIWRYPEPESL